MSFKRLNPHFIYLDSVDSTNNYAANLIKTSIVESGTTVVTRKQTSGKGQRGNSWESEDEKNLIFSLVLFPQIKIKDTFYLNIATSLAVQKTLGYHLNLVKIKWPNDILVGTKKIAGILIENQIKSDFISSSVIGIGVNVNQDNFNPTLNATSMKSELNQDFNLENLMAELYTNLDFYFNLLMENNFKILISRYYENLFRFKAESEFEDGLGKFSGSIQGIDDNGRLIVLRNKIPTIYDLKEIKFLL